jgi:hypothetical protein
MGGTEETVTNSPDLRPNSDQVTDGMDREGHPDRPRKQCPIWALL